MSIRAKILLLGVIPTVLAALFIGVLAVYFHTTVLTRQIVESGKNFTYTLGLAVEDAMLANDYSIVSEIDNSFNKLGLVLANFVYRGDGVLVAAAPNDKKVIDVFNKEFQKIINEGKIKGMEFFNSPVPLVLKDSSYSRFIVTYYGIQNGILGYAFAVFPTAFDAVVKTQKKLVLIVNGVSVVFVLFLVVVSVLLGNSLANRLEYLKEAAENLSLGDLDTPIEYKGKDELSSVAESLERMRQSLKAAIERLRRR